MARKTFGQFIRERRLALGLGLRDFCIVAKQDPSNYSKYERGILVPPPEPQLKRIAKALQIEVGDNKQWHHLTALAAAARLEIPPDWGRDERVMELLPAFYQKLRGYETGDGEDPLEALTKILRKEV